MALAAVAAAGLMPLVMRARFIAPDSVASAQNVHLQPTSRLGGTILFVAYVLGLGLAVALHNLPFDSWVTLLACALPIFFAGIWEDMTHRLPPRQRLLAALASAVLASALIGNVIARLDLPYLDFWLDFRLFAILLTCFMVVGACNALNLIDGTHGLAGGTALLMFIGMASAANHVGDQLIFVFSVSMIGALAGFLFWNYPRGRVFLGDGGAYFIGFIYAQLSIMIVARHDEISAWFVIMLAAYPIVETLFSIYRRKVRLRTPPMQPDALHLHSLVHQQAALAAGQGLPAASPDQINARVAPTLWLHGAVCCCIAVYFHQSTLALIAGFIAYVVFYTIHYSLLWKFRRAHPGNTLGDDPVAPAVEATREVGQSLL